MAEAAQVTAYAGLLEEMENAAAFEPVTASAEVNDLNDRVAAGWAKALPLEERLAAKYEQAGRGLARRARRRYERAQPVIAAARMPNWLPEPDELVTPEDASAAAARTQAARRAIVQAMVGSILGIEASRDAVFRALIEAQAGRQAERLVEGSRDAVARVILDAQVEGWGVPQTAEAIQTELEAVSRWQSVMLARTDLISLSNASSVASASLLGADAPPFKVWLATSDNRTRPDHHEAEGQTVPTDQSFTVGGESLAYPGDPAGSDGNVINCFPGGTTLLSPGTRAAVRSWYDGYLVRIETDAAHELSGTPNHPVLTSAGWKRLDELQEGDSLVCGALCEDVLATYPDVEDVPAEAEQVFAALSRTGKTFRAGRVGVDLHGRVPEGQVDVVLTACQLKGGVEVSVLEPTLHQFLTGSDVSLTSLVGDGSTDEFVLGANHPPNGSLGSGSPSVTLLGCGVRHAYLHGLLSVPGLDSECQQLAADDAPGDPELFCERGFGGAVEVTLAKIVNVDRSRFVGHVYSLETTSESYFANGILARNCRCTVRYAWEPNPGFAPNAISAAFSPSQPRYQVGVREGGRWRPESGEGTLDDLAARHPDVEVWASDHGDGITLHMIRTKPGARGTGAASRALRDLTAMADRRGVPMWLTPEAMGDDAPMGTDQLARWYRRHGWANANESGLMRRDPAITAATVTEEDEMAELTAAERDWLAQECISLVNRARELKINGGESLVSAGTGEPMEAIEVPLGEVGVLIASAPVAPPEEWFQDPGLTEPTPLTVTPEGRVFGHLAQWGRCHTGIGGRCVIAPRSQTGYEAFHTGSVLTDSGRQVRIGKITARGPHADLNMSGMQAASHYDHSAMSAAYVRAGEDEHGPWLAGAVRSDATPEQIAELRAHPPSGDWRQVGPGGALELVAALAVPVPGFPVAAIAASGAHEGEVTALIMGFDDLQPLALAASCGCDELEQLLDDGALAGLPEREVRMRTLRAV